MTALLLDDLGLCLLAQLSEAWADLHIVRDESAIWRAVATIPYSELVIKDAHLNDTIVQFAQHVSFLYDNREYDTRPKTSYVISNQLLDWIANMEFEQQNWGSADEDTLTEIAMEALNAYTDR